MARPVYVARGGRSFISREIEVSGRLGVSKVSSCTVRFRLNFLSTRYFNIKSMYSNVFGPCQRQRPLLYILKHFDSTNVFVGDNRDISHSFRS